MLIQICPEGYDIDEGRNYVWDNLRDVGVEFSVIVSMFEKIDKDDDPDEAIDPMIFEHVMLVANIPTLEKFIEVVHEFEKGKYVSIETEPEDMKKWTLRGYKLMTTANEKYYKIPCLVLN